MKAQTIEIDSIFNSDGEIFPFSPNDTIYGLSISGSVTLSSDTSLVRVILTDISGNEWMVYEAYPMIVSEMEFDIVEECDETCFLQSSVPYSILIQIIEAEINIAHLSVGLSHVQDAIELQLQAKFDKDLGKSQRINQYITAKGWNWVGDTTELVKMFYSEKTLVFGDKYNLLGRDYYSDGSFNSILHEGIPIFRESTIITHFDWREKHNAHLPGSRYYGGETNETDNGWMTGIRHQGRCGTCGVFSTIGTLEAAINLYANYHFDIEEETDFSEKDAYNCSWWYGVVGENYTVGCNEDCSTGKGISTVMEKLKNEGVVDEICYEYKFPYCEGSGPDCSFSSKCPYPVMTAQICNEKEFIIPDVELQEDRAAFLKEVLINNGPLSVIIDNWDASGVEHAVTLVGFDEVDGQIEWSYKNSHGLDYGTGGYGKEVFWLGRSDGQSDDPCIMETLHAINYDEVCQNPITVICYHDCPTQDWTYEVHDNDLDKDGYYNWGIGPRINTHPCGIAYEKEDSNDDDKHIGPYEEDYSGKFIMPIMYVLQGSGLGIPITNGEVIPINESNAQNIIKTFTIRNSGTAQLNLEKTQTNTGRVEIDYQNNGLSFGVTQPEDTSICMNNYTTFLVTIQQYSVAGSLAHIHIYVDDDDIDDFEFTLIFNSCETQSGFLPIYGETFWDKEYRTQLQDAHVMTDATLTISGEVIFSAETDIIVEPGGKLIIDGGKLTSSCGSLWNGINIWGDPRQPQIMHAQGMVEIKNGGMIEYADTAISTAQFINISYYSSGGIVSCKDAIFKDNTFDVVFHPYNNTNPYTHQIIANASRFTRTRFETTDDYYDIIHSVPEAHIKMNEVGGIRFAGCTFYNSSAHDDYFRGIGIESANAGYTVNNFCSEDIIPCPGEQPCNFENLDYGIRAFNNNDYFPILVDSADFIHNRRGMYLGLINHPIVVKNRFDLSDPAGNWTDDPIIGLYLDEFTTGYLVEENQFYCNTTTSESFGIHLLNNGPVQNEIYNNSFSLLSTGIIAVGDNRLEDTGVGLCIKCNDFTDCMDDISVTPALDENEIPIITDNTGIALWQGEEGNGDDLAAGNTFSEYAKYNYINDEGCRKIDYIHHNENSTVKKVKPVPTAGDMNVNPDEDAYYSKEESCPSHLTGGGITLSQEKLQLTSETELISAYQDTLIAMVDGGNTESLNYEVLTSYPEEALVIRQELIEESPFLSDTVMISAIEKEDVFPGAMIRDVLVQNPQAPKSNDVMNALNQRQDTIPGYMMEEILEGMAVYGEKELLEQQMGQHIAKRDMAWRNLNHYFKGDTSNAGPYSDSLIALYENENRPEARYDLCFMHLSREDSSSLFNTLSDIPIEFDLSTDELFIHNQYQDLFGILWEVKMDSTGLDSLQIQSLHNLCTPIHSVPANYAFNLLISKGLIGYNEPVYSVKLLKSVTAPAQSPQVNELPDRLMVFPNPAGNYFIVQYDLSGFKEYGVLAISDMNGKELTQYGLTDMKNQVVISTADYPSGNYIIHLIGGYNIVSSEKISVIR